MVGFDDGLKRSLHQEFADGYSSRQIVTLPFAVDIVQSF